MNQFNQLFPRPSVRFFGTYSLAVMILFLSSTCKRASGPAPQKWVGTYEGSIHVRSEGEKAIYDNRGTLLRYEPYVNTNETEGTFDLEWQNETVLAITNDVLEMYMDTEGTRVMTEGNCMSQSLPDAYGWIEEEACLSKRGKNLSLSHYRDALDILPSF